MTAKIKTRLVKSSSQKHPYKPKGVSQKAFKKVYWPYIPIVLIIGVLLVLSSSAGALTKFVHYPNGQVLSYATSMSINGLLSATNSARSQNGVPALTLDDRLNAAAQAKANDMADRNYWSHDTPEGNPPWIFVTAQKYSYLKLGENLAAGFSDEQATVNGWMASSPHRANLLDKAFKNVGFGFANNPNYTSAGGGPMTIVVAFYGDPQVLASQSFSPVSSTTPKSTQTSSPKNTVPTVPTPKPSTAAPEPEPEPQPAKETPVPAPNTESNVSSANLASRSSHAQLALANLPVATFATSLALAGTFAAIGIWISRHALAVRRAIAMGEAFAIRHPLMDIGLLIIAALSFLLTQTAGLIQ